MIGLFFVGEKRARTELNHSLMRGLTQLRAETSKALRLIGQADLQPHTNMLLTVELPDSKPQVMTVDQNGHAQTSVRFSVQATRWAEVTSNICLDLVNAVSVQWEASPDINKEQLFELTFLSAIKPLCRSIIDAKGMINNQMADPSDPLVPNDPPSRRRGPRSRESPEVGSPVVKAELLIPPSSVAEPGGSKERRDKPLTNEMASTVVTLKGTMLCRAFVPRKATVDEGLMALKLDVIRSLMARCRLHSEGLFLIDPDQGDMVRKTHFSHLCRYSLFPEQYRHSSNHCWSSLSFFYYSIKFCCCCVCLLFSLLIHVPFTGTIASTSSARVLFAAAQLLGGQRVRVRRRFTGRRCGHAAAQLLVTETAGIRGGYER